jgi:hypothetical protein
VVLGLTAETEAGRGRAAEERAARDAALGAKRQKLKAAFLQHWPKRAPPARLAGVQLLGRVVSALADPRIRFPRSG